MTYVKQLYDYLGRLAVNNNREWFALNKEEFDYLRAQWLEDVQRLIGLMSEYDQSLRGLVAKDCVYRIYRDIRFSPDKSPYKTYFSAVLGRGGRKCQGSCYYVHLQPGNSGLHGGIWCPEKNVLDALRHAIDDNADEFRQIITDRKFSGLFNLYGEKLKNVPRGYASDNPNAEYIKMKEYLLQGTRPDQWFCAENWVEKASGEFKAMLPFHRFINFTIENEVDK